jgi:hypothetical protein
MTDPQEPSENVTSLGSSDRDPDPATRRPDDPAGGAGSDVGGPAGTTESSAESAVGGTPEPGSKESADPDDQATGGV